LDQYPIRQIYGKQSFIFGKQDELKTEKVKYCPSCGKEFICGTCSKELTCWCAALPNIEIIEKGGQCLCPDCLKELIRQKVDSFVADVQTGKRDNIAPQFKGNGKELIEGIDFYLENGQ
jgi:hypothetical protein